MATADPERGGTDSARTFCGGGPENTTDFGSLGLKKAKQNEPTVRETGRLGVN